GGDPSRLSHDITALWAEELDEMRARPDRLPDAVTALFGSAVSALYIKRRPVHEAIDRVAVPTLLLLGDQEPLVGGPVIDREDVDSASGPASAGLTWCGRGVGDRVPAWPAIRLTPRSGCLANDLSTGPCF